MENSIPARFISDSSQFQHHPNISNVFLLQLFKGFEGMLEFDQY